MEKPAVESIVKTAGNGTKRWYNRMKKQTAAITAVVCVFLFATHTQALEVPARVTRTVTTTQKIPFATSYIDLPGIYRGYEEPVRSGTPGEQKIEAQVIYEAIVPSRWFQSKRSRRRSL